MEPLLVLPYSEWLVAEQLKKAFPANQGYSIYAPLSRQEKEVDLVLVRRWRGVSRAATLQVKYARAFEKGPKYVCKFEAWFRRFRVLDRADFFVLVSLYPNVTGRGGGKRSSWWHPLLLLFGRQEMEKLISSLRNRRGRPDCMFYVGFDSPKRILLTRGGGSNQPDLSKFSFARQLKLLRRYLAP